MGEPYVINIFELEPYSSNNNGLVQEIVKTLFELNSIEYKIVHYPRKRAINNTIANKYSAVTPLQRAQERETMFKWVGPIIVTETILFSKINFEEEIQVLEDALKYKVITSVGSVDEKYCRDMGFDVLTTNRESGKFLMLKNNRAQLIAEDPVVAEYNSLRYKVSLKKQISILTTLRSIAFNKDVPDSVIDQLNSSLKQIYTDGTMKQLMEEFSIKNGIKLSTKYLE